MFPVDTIKQVLSLILRTAGVAPVAGDVLSYQGSNQVEWVPQSGLAPDHGGLAGLTDDDHTQYIKHDLADATNDFLVASGADVFAKKTLAETGAILEADLDHGNIQGIADDDHTDYLIGRDSQCLLYHTANQNVNNNTVTTLTWNSEYADPDGMHDPVGAATRITIPTTGRYLIGFIISWDQTTNDIIGAIELNGTGVFICRDSRQQAAIVQPASHAAELRALTAADYIEVVGYQNSGGAINVLANAGAISCVFYAMRVA
jgi:hypothetical protein